MTTPTPTPATAPSESWRDPVLRRVAIIGAGAMGCSLAAITAPHIDTVIVARDPARAARIREAGIDLRGALEATGHPTVVSSIRDLSDIHPIDLVFIATKTTAIPAVCEQMAPDLLSLPYIVSYQNGIEPGREIIRRLGTPRVIRMVLHYGATLEASSPDALAAGPVRVRATFQAAPHFIGGEGERAQAFARALARRLSGMGLTTAFAPDIDIEVWRKGVLNAAANPVAALTRIPLDGLMTGPARPLVLRLVDEALRVAAAAAIDLGPAARADAVRMLESVGDHLPSMAEDVIAGRSTEITQLNLQIAQRAAELGLPAPTHHTIVELIRAIDDRLAEQG